MKNQDWAVLSVLWLIAGYLAVLTVLSSSPIWALVAVFAATIAAAWGLALRHRRTQPGSSFVSVLTEQER